MATQQLQLQGMSCASCAKAIDEAIKAVPGVTSVNVNFAEAQAVVSFDAQQTNLEAIQQAVTDAGFRAIPSQPPKEQPPNELIDPQPSTGIPVTKQQLQLQGMSCAACASAIEKAIAGVAGVNS
ncbi:MAG: copper ion binding protein, partial [Cyanobacteria bacterium P01_F01_bin.86]